MQRREWKQEISRMKEQKNYFIFVFRIKYILCILDKMNKLFACVCACAGKFRIESSARWRYLFFGLCTYTMLSVWMCLYLGNESGLCTCVCSRIWFLENISLDGQNAKTRLLSCTSQTIGFAFSSTSCIFDLFCSFPFTRLFPKIAPLVCCFFLLR